MLVNEITVRSEPAIRIHRSWVTLLSGAGSVLGGASFDELPTRILVGADVSGISLHIEPLDSGTIYLAADSQEVLLPVIGGQAIEETWVFVGGNLRLKSVGFWPELSAMIGVAMLVVVSTIMMKDIS